MEILRRRSRSRVILLILLSFSLIILFIRYNFTLSATTTSSDSNLNTNNYFMRKKHILFLTKPYYMNRFIPQVDEARRKCPQCEFTHKRNEWTWRNSDAIIFNGRFLKNPPTKFRPPNQIWIFLQEEPIALKALADYQNLFNWTLSFRHDSDIYLPYFRIVNNTSTISVFNSTAVLERIRKKTKPIAWIVSHCKTQSKREELVANLTQFIPVDVYGGCGPHKCRLGRTSSAGSECRAELSSSYKFYLAFEHSLCEDYITEKFFDTLLTDMVPIVYGRGNYSGLGLPPGSFVNVADFDSLEALANHLKWLDKNPEEIIRFLERRHGYEIDRRTYERAWCDICAMLWNRKAESKSYEDPLKWWQTSSAGDGGAACIEPEELPIMRNTRTRS